MHAKNTVLPTYDSESTELQKNLINTRAITDVHHQQHTLYTLPLTSNKPTMSPPTSTKLEPSSPSTVTVKKFVARRKGEPCVWCRDDSAGNDCILDKDAREEYKVVGQDLLDGLNDDTMTIQRKYKSVRFHLYRKFASDFLGDANEPLPTCVETTVKLMWRCPKDEYVGYKHTSTRRRVKK